MQPEVKTLPISFHESQDEILADLNGTSGRAPDAFLSEALKMLLTPEQLEDIRKKLAAKPAPATFNVPVTKNEVVWSISNAPTTGQLFLHAIYHRGNGLSDVTHFFGHPEKLKKFRRDHAGNWTPFTFHHSVVPDQLVEEYTRRFNPLNDGSLAIPYGAQPTPDFSRCPGPGYDPSTHRKPLKY